MTIWTCFYQTESVRSELNEQIFLTNIKFQSEFFVLFLSKLLIFSDVIWNARDGNKPADEASHQLIGTDTGSIYVGIF
jgi:hypothetical protein